MAAKGYDDSPPRNGVIFFYSVLTVVLLIGVQQLLNSYFAKMMDVEYQEKVYSNGLGHAIEVKAAEQQALEKAGIDSAKQLYAQRGRSASTAISTESGANKPAIGGWSQLKREVPAAPAAVPVPRSAPQPPEGVAPAAVQAPAESGNTSPAAGAGVTTTPTSTGRVPAPAAAGTPAPSAAPGAQH